MKVPTSYQEMRLAQEECILSYHHHPPAHEAQCSFQVSVPTEGSAQLGMKRKQARPELHREESPRAGAGPGAKAGLTPPVFHTAVREGILL